MRLPPLTDDDLQTFLREGVWVAKIATGKAAATPEPTYREEYARHFGRYMADRDTAVESYKILTSLCLGDRARVRFHPERRVTWDFSKIPQA